MARTCILHIGTTKTGSTSIQHMLRGATSVLRRQGVYYPDTDSDIGHMKLAAMFGSDPGVFQDVRSQVWRGRDPVQVMAEHAEAFAAEMHALPPSIERVIISAEQFSQFVRRPEDIRRLHALLSGFFDAVKIVLYLRRQDSHFVSTHAQLLRMGKMRTPDIQQLRPWYHDYDYADLIGRWAAVFGEASMQPRVFDRWPGNSFDVIDDFTATCGLEIPAAICDLGRARNPSMNAAGQRILVQSGQLLRRGGHGRDAESLAAWQLVSRSVSSALPGTGWQPTRAEAAAFMAQFAQTNETVRRTWFPEKPALFHEGFDHLPETAQPTDAAADFRSACAVIVEMAREVTRGQQRVVNARAQAARRSEDISAYRAALLKAVKLDGADVAARVRLARVQIEEGATQSARHNLAVALKLQPEHTAARNLLRRLNRAERGAAIASMA